MCTGGEYDEKLAIYRKLGVIYYVIYNPEFWKRDGHLPFEGQRHLSAAEVERQRADRLAQRLCALGEDV
jgi:hypothetical protein